MTIQEKQLGGQVVSEWLTREQLKEWRDKAKQLGMSRQFHKLIDQAEAFLDCQEVLSAISAEGIAKYMGEGKIGKEELRAYAAVLRRPAGERQTSKIDQK